MTDNAAEWDEQTYRALREERPGDAALAQKAQDIAEARRAANEAHDAYVRAADDLHDTNVTLLGHLVQAAYPTARSVVTEGVPPDDLEGTDSLTLLSILDADGRVLADQAEPTERWDALLEECNEVLQAIIETDPATFNKQVWQPLP